MNKVSGFILPIGVALVVLIYTTIGALTYTTARADHNLTQRSIVYNQSYYSAETKLEELIYETQQIAGGSAADFEAALQKLEERFPVIVESTGGNDIRILFFQAVSEHVVYHAQIEARLGESVRLVSSGLENVEQWKEKKMELWEG